ncbi:helicase-associated domain-containing protein [Streptomyces albireticuli]|uniref:helicase-associated domain-containing protein n=1 Tax=Streptomyces albireticuli TaxID=1940 RepID=UPI0036746CFF
MTTSRPEKHTSGPRTERAPAHAPSAAPARTLAEELRGRPDDSLAALLRARPDLLNPVPGDLTQLATRAGTRASVVRALDRLDRFTLQVAEALAVAPDPCSYATLDALMGGDAPGDPAIAAELPRAVAVLRGQALVWGGEDRLRLVRTVRELLAPSPAHPSPTGLGPSAAEATAGMSPGRVQQIIATAGLPATHDPVTAVAALTELFEDRARMSALLDTAPADATAVLGRLVWGPPYGTVTAEPAAHLRWLLDRGLLLPAGPGSVLLPREVALHLRAGRAHRYPEPVAPELAPVTEHSPRVVDATAAGQAFTALTTVEDLLKGWETGGPLVLRAGGLSVRDLKRTAAALDTTEQAAAFWAELAYAAGLLASDGDVDERYAPTPAYDDWLQLPAEQRWTRLATAWLAATRTAGPVGGRDAKARTLAALGPDLDRAPAPEVRHRVLALLATLPPGGSVTPETLLRRLHWERPPRGTVAGGQAGAAQAAAQATRPPTAAAPGTPPHAPHDDLRSRLALWTLTEAEMLGVTNRGALTDHGRALLGAETGGGAETAPAPWRPAGEAELGAAAVRAAARLAPLLPEPLDHVLLQADLTAVAPGPLRRPLAQVLGVLADVESKGGATVYRFTPGSVRRALDAGRTATDLKTFLTEHSRTPVPQPLSYLIDDVARRHGHLRVGAASSYVRCDDEAVLAEILADRRSAPLRPRRLAPTVLAAQVAPDALLDGLRAMGYAPAAESAEGDVVVTRADAHRTPPRTAPAPVPEGPPVPDPTLLGAAVRAIRAGDMASTAERKPTTAPAPASGGLPRTTSADTLATVQAAVLTGAAVWIGYVNAEGAASQRVIAPVRVEGGFVTAYDHTADEIRTYPLHRITGVAELVDDTV